MPKTSRLARFFGLKPPKVISPVTPWLIQRCKLDESGRFKYDYMGSSEFEVGDQAEALKRLFTGQIAMVEVSVQANNGGAIVPVFLLTQSGFDASAYQSHLQRLADGKLHLQEPARFNNAVDWEATRFESRSGRVSAYDIWFDFTKYDEEQNIVLFTLDESKRADLLARLKVVTDIWAKNSATEQKHQHPT
ncbi:MAG: hypothetical protein A2845_03755 [Candidatus Lloydbacteria bacterium RIFCSPHIGHO2_01_FULL_49_22]|uniref:Uncharacterized protein n=1 Tax=Candidatus Lloydbacteria bacterium RIFCSPHIGHO2_01_FULL_49_22 TaxID=1798658 RepID=A0A1G2CYY6_9BACT|nr:MAG: hypothetical protein A2845_03755 [Candidatus Lloydbacteria bacterium RIFCSPHIGHO2_01_FULL_49_22]OGZ09043.1 MAG: hypothetical protein A3C14_03590 [Candidatus Lloydbacteria bacterium RIFCSPHIGHO2_02_FULL_50_18]